MDNEVSVSAISLHNEIAPMAGNAHRSGRHSLSKDAGDRGSTAAGPDSGNRTWKSQVQGFGNRTTTHGISYIVNASSHFSRTIWLVIFLAAMAALVAQVGLLIKQYFDRDVIVEIKLVTDEQLPFPTVTVCNTNMIRRSAVKDTVHRELLVFDSDLVRPYYVPCYDGDFQCADGKHCIKPFNQCDGTIHCPDNSDEQNCTYGFCGEEQFRCKSGSESGVCIPEDAECDKKFDCYEGEDEDDCECEGEEDFRCVVSNECIRQLSVCDGSFDCRDGSDESQNLCPPPLQILSRYRTTTGSHPVSLTSLAVDGDNDTCYRSDVNWDKYWQVKLDRRYTVYEVRITHHFVLSRTIPLEGAVIYVGPFAEYTQDTRCTQGLSRAVVATLTFTVRCDDPINGQFLTIVVDSGDDPTALTLCEVEVLGLDSLYANVALRKSASQSSQYRDGSAVKAVDGDHDPDYHHRSCMHTDFDYEPWWQVDLGESYVISDVIIANRNDCCSERILNAEVQVATRESFNNYTVCGDRISRKTAENRVIMINCAPHVTGRYIRLQIKERSDYLHVCEVQVYGQVDVDNLPNVAKGKSAEQSSTVLSFTADRAVDGDIPEGNNQLTCAVTVVEKNPWWSVDLEKIYRVYRVALSFMDCCQEDLTSLVIRVGYWEINKGEVNALCGTIGDYNADKTQLAVHCNVPMLGKYVSVQHEGAAVSLTLCEVQVHAEEFKRDFSAQIWRERLYANFDKQNERLLVPSDAQQTETVTQVTIDACIEMCSTAKRYICKSFSYNSDSNTCLLSRENAADEGATLRHDKHSVYYQNLVLNKYIPPANSSSCPEDMWSCGSGECIHKYSVCDVIKDCDDSSDEVNCTNQVEGNRNSEVSDIISRLKGHFEDLTKNASVFEHFRDNVYVAHGFDRVMGEDPPDWTRFKAFSRYADYSDVKPALKLSNAEIAALGHTKEGFIVQCAFAGQECDMSQILEFQDRDYGNCFSFNPGRSDNNGFLFATGPGPSLGLEMILFTEQSEYIALYGQDSGVRVTITPAGALVIPFIDGFTIKPGTITSAGLTFNVRTRTPKPYGDCLESFPVQGFNTDLKYSTRRGCQLQCFQNALVTHCSCSTRNSNNPDDTSRCLLLNKTQEVCRQLLGYIFFSGIYTCECPPPCTEFYYSKSLSQSLWPSDVYLKYLLKSLLRKNEKLKDINDMMSARSNLVKLEVYITDMNYESVNERPVYTWEDLLSDIGGTLGLYVGISVISVCEFIHFCLELCRSSFGQKKSIDPT